MVADKNLMLESENEFIRHDISESCAVNSLGRALHLLKKDTMYDENLVPKIAVPYMRTLLMFNNAQLNRDN